MKARRYMDLGGRSSPNALKGLGLVVATALTVAGCGGSNQQAAAGSATGRAGPMPSKSPGKPELHSPAASARKLATQSCETWRSGSMQVASQGSVRLRMAAGTAAKASSLDEHWKLLSNGMAYVSSLPITGNSEDAVAQARLDLMDIHSACSALGVVLAF